MTARDCLWKPQSTDVTLPDDEVHVWRASLDPPRWYVQQLAETLSMDEQMRARRFYFEQDRKRFITGRGLLRTILGGYTACEPNQLQFCYGCYGKPALTQTFGGGTLRFNLAHSQGIALYAVTRRWEVGVDLECIRSVVEYEQIAEHFFSSREKAVLRALLPHRKQEAFFTCWTRKEAYLKACGDGLARPLDRIEVSLVPGERAKLLSIDGDSHEASYWSMQELAPAPGYVAALAVAGHGWRLACWQWPEQ